jgi:hypothetical protein
MKVLIHDDLTNDYVNHRIHTKFQSINESKCNQTTRIPAILVYELAGIQVRRSSIKKQGSIHAKGMHTTLERRADNTGTIEESSFG